MALQDCLIIALVQFLGRMSCLLNQTLDNQRARSVVGVMNEITRLILCS